MTSDEPRVLSPLSTPALKPPSPPEGALVIVAKLPIPGRCKTRLSGLLGSGGSAALAKAMLSDVLLGVDRYVSQRESSRACGCPGPLSTPPSGAA